MYECQKHQSVHRLNARQLTESAHTRHFFQNTVSVFYGRRCVRSLMDKRVCDKLSQILPPARVTILRGTQCRVGSKFRARFGSWMQRWWLTTASNEIVLVTAGRGGIEKTRWKLWLREHGIITAWITNSLERGRLFWRGSGGTTFQTKTAAEEIYKPNALAVPKTAFSHAMIVMDKVGGWNEEDWVESKFAAGMWIYTKAVLCDGRGRPPQDLRQMLRIIMECVSWVCEDFLWEHEWVTEPNVFCKERCTLPTPVETFVVLFTVGTQSKNCK